MDDENTAMRGGTAYELGRLHGRITALETRVDKQEGILSGIDAKLDSVLLSLASAVGGRERMGSLIKISCAVMVAAGAVGGLVTTAFHYTGH